LEQATLQAGLRSLERVKTFPFLVMLWNEALSKHSRDMGLHAGGSLELLCWLSMVLAGCQNPPKGNS